MKTHFLDIQNTLKDLGFSFNKERHRWYHKSDIGDTTNLTSVIPQINDENFQIFYPKIYNWKHFFIKKVYRKLSGNHKSVE